MKPAPLAGLAVSRTQCSTPESYSEGYLPWVLRGVLRDILRGVPFFFIFFFIFKPNTLSSNSIVDERGGTADTKNSKPSEAQVEQLYGLYPRKRDKLDAKKAIRKAVAAVMAGDADHPALSVDDALDYLAQRVSLYAKCVQRCDQEFIPYPASWFNAGAFWDDERDWSSRSKGPKNITAVTLPDSYVSASDKIRQERSAGGLQ